MGVEAMAAEPKQLQYTDCTKYKRYKQRLVSQFQHCKVMQNSGPRQLAKCQFGHVDLAVREKCLSKDSECVPYASCLCDRETKLTKPAYVHVSFDWQKVLSLNAGDRSAKSATYQRSQAALCKFVCQQ